MSTVRIRPIEDRDRSEVAELIAVSMNTWDIAHGFAPGRFAGGSPQTDVFYTVYQRLDPGWCAVAESTENGRLAASCYYRERETHLSLGIMNVHPNYFGQGIARDVLAHVTDLADASGKPLRLVSSVMNLESFSSTRGPASSRASSTRICWSPCRTAASRRASPAPSSCATRPSTTSMRWPTSSSR